MAFDRGLEREEPSGQHPCEILLRRYMEEYPRAMRMGRQSLIADALYASCRRYFRVGEWSGIEERREQREQDEWDLAVHDREEREARELGGLGPKDQEPPDQRRG